MVLAKGVGAYIALCGATAGARASVEERGAAISVLGIQKVLDSAQDNLLLDHSALFVAGGNEFQGIESLRAAYRCLALVEQ
jgi:hypothetical protein